jgi:hypothetical protein
MPAIPGLSGLPSLTGGAGGAAGPASGTANNGLSLPLSTPTNIDGSGWIVNFGNGNTSDAKGNTGANNTQQTATPTATASTNAAGSGAPNGQGYWLPTPQQVYAGAASGGLIPPGGPGGMVLILGAVGVLLMLRK